MNKTGINETFFNDNIMQWKIFSFIIKRFLVILDGILIQIYDIALKEGKIHPNCLKLRLQSKEYIEWLSLRWFEEYSMKFLEFQNGKKINNIWSRK